MGEAGKMRLPTTSYTTSYTCAEPLIPRCMKTVPVDLALTRMLDLS